MILIRNLEIFPQKILDQNPPPSILTHSITFYGLKNGFKELKHMFYITNGEKRYKLPRVICRLKK